MPYGKYMLLPKRLNNLIGHLLALPPTIYKQVLSPLMPAACRFHPTCADYTCQAFRTHGAVRGSWLSLRRLLRCNPWGNSGIDPVPPAY